jgi:hypothetical protein
MFDKNNSIKEILKNTKNSLIKDKELSKEKENFDFKISKALDGNILVLNRVYSNDSNDEIDKRTKKITQIVEHQSKNTLLLNKEIEVDSQVLLLNKEIQGEGETLILENKNLETLELQNIVEEPSKENKSPEKQNNPQVESEVATNPAEEKSYLSILDRVSQIEKQKQTIFKKLDQIVEEARLRDPSEEISLKFDILSNQISNDMDSKIDLLHSEISTIHEEKDGIYQELNSQKELVESGFVDLEQSNDHLKKQIDAINTKIEEGQKNQTEEQKNQTESLNIKIEEGQKNQEETIESKLLLFENKINEKFLEIQNILEEDREKRKFEEEEKNKDPNYQANQRLNSIYKILEAQMSQSLINNSSSNNGYINRFENENVSVKNDSSVVADIESSGAFRMMNQKLELISKSTHVLLDAMEVLKNQDSNSGDQGIDNSKIESISNQLQSLVEQQNKLDEVHSEIYSLSKQQDKLNEVHSDIRSLLEQQNKLDEVHSDIHSLSKQQSKIDEILNYLKSSQKQKPELEKVDSLIKHFKNNELKELNHLQFDFNGEKQFDDLKSSKEFLEKLILSETQNWIQSNQKTIEDISKKLLYK